MTNEAKAAAILDSAVEFLANKHGVSKQTIADAVIGKNARICDQLATLMASLIVSLPRT